MQPKTVLSISAKCSDLYSHTLRKADGSEVTYDGYVPSFFPEQHFGDYLMLDIDPYTGTILNWKKWKRAKRCKTCKELLSKHVTKCKTRKAKIK